jgi:hypothetical protein
MKLEKTNRTTKVDLGGAAREVSAEEGAAFARERGCLYKETSAKVRARRVLLFVWRKGRWKGGEFAVSLATHTNER